MNEILRWERRNNKKRKFVNAVPFKREQCMLYLALKKINYNRSTARVIVPRVNVLTIIKMYVNSRLKSVNQLICQVQQLVL